LERNYGVRGWRLVVQRLVSWQPATDFFSHFVHYLDLLSLKISKGRFSPSGFLAGWPIITLTTTGAKSGLLRTLPLVGIQDGEKIILIASNFGRPNHPSWYYNLKANPEARLVVGGREGEYRASQTTDKERDLYWQMAVSTNIGFNRYQERAGSRRIPIVVLTPWDSPDEDTSARKGT